MRVPSWLLLHFINLNITQFLLIIIILFVMQCCTCSFLSRFHWWKLQLHSTIFTNLLRCHETIYPHSIALEISRNIKLCWKVRPLVVSHHQLYLSRLTRNSWHWYLCNYLESLEYPLRILKSALRFIVNPWVTIVARRLWFVNSLQFQVITTAFVVNETNGK